MRSAFFIVAFGVLTLAVPFVAADDKDAHALAEKFAGASRDAQTAEDARKRAEADRLKAVKAAADAKRKSEDAKRRAEAARQKAEQLKADEAEMLERARAEAAEREAEQKRALAELEQAEAERAAAEERTRAEAEARAAAEAQRAAIARSEAEVKARTERLEAETRAKADAERAANERRAADKAAEAKRAADRAAAEKAATKRAEAERVEKERRAAEEIRQQKLAAEKIAVEKAGAERQARARADAEERDRARRQAEMAARHAAEEQALARAQAEESRRIREAEEQKLILEAEREAEALRLSEKIRKAREARAARRAPGEEPLTVSAAPTAGAAARVALGGPSARPAAGTRVAVLLVMEPGTRGIRRFNKSADPMLCVQEACYVSEGPDRPSKRLARSAAFGPGVALGSRAGACNNALGCVFRDIDLEAASALLQPIDLRIVRHDRREAAEVRPDESCAASAGRIDCRSTVSTSTWRAWVVPEEVARRAGGIALTSALAAGLPTAEARVRDER